MRAFFGLLLLLASTLLLVQCQRNQMVLDDPEAMLEFSVDTLRFDTVFTELGSATRSLKIYNRYNQPVNISRISIESADSRFRINVDGIPGNVATDVEIPANDSIYLFGEVTVNPDDPLSISPFVIEDALVFETNGNIQKVVLEAWGQNANYIPSRFNKGGVALLSCNFAEETWDDPKPYVIYGILFIDSCTLNLPAGVQIYVHGGVAQAVDEDGNVNVYNDGLIYVLPNGHINIEGTLEDPVILQGDRLEEPFSDISGQWVGLVLTSEDNNIRHAEIKNSLLGVLIDSAGVLDIRHSRIYNTSSSGMIARRATIYAENCLVYNNGSTSLQISFGGDYEFNYCTFASYGVDAGAVLLSNGVCYDPLCEQNAVFPLNATFRNTILFGSRRDELSLVDFTEGMSPETFQYEFDHCIVRVEELIDPDKGGYTEFLTNQCATCINGTSTDALFVDPSEGDYSLDTLSIAEQQALPLPGINTDLLGNPRDPVSPDIGCLEYQDE